MSVRRGYHVIPKHIFGIPADEFGESGPSLPLRVERPVFTALLRVLQGDLTRLGLPKPDHKLFESHPLLNSQLLHYLQHGDVTVKADVAAFEGDRVRFTDGSTEQVDLVLFATGYDWTIPYVPTEYFRWRDGRPELYLTAFSREHHNLFGLSFLEVNSSAYTLFDQVSNLVAQYLHDQVHDPDRAAAFDRMIATEHPDLSGGIRFVDSARHQVVRRWPRVPHGAGQGHRPHRVAAPEARDVRQAQAGAATVAASPAYAGGRSPPIRKPRAMLVDVCELAAQMWPLPGKITARPSGIPAAVRLNRSSE